MPKSWKKSSICWCRTGNVLREAAMIGSPSRSFGRITGLTARRCVLGMHTTTGSSARHFDIRRIFKIVEPELKTETTEITDESVAEAK
jgi:hypothetical protein